MKEEEQPFEELKAKYDILIQAVHDMNDMIRQLRDDNEKLKRTIEDLQDG